MGTIKIILADDEPLFRNGIAFLLQREPDIEVLFEASDGSELLAHLRETENLPDSIIMDLKMPMLNGVETTRILCDEFPQIKIIALTSYNTKPFIANMITIGASAYLVKNTTPTHLISTIREVAKKGFHYDAYVLEVIREGTGVIQKSRSAFDNTELTSREREVLKFVCMQYSTKEIAEKLFINHRTVEGHRNNLLLKTESRNMAGLVVYALQHEVLGLEDLIR